MRASNKREWQICFVIFTENFKDYLGNSIEYKNLSWDQISAPFLCVAALYKQVCYFSVSQIFTLV